MQPDGRRTRQTLDVRFYLGEFRNSVTRRIPHPIKMIGMTGSPETERRIHAPIHVHLSSQHAATPRRRHLQTYMRLSLLPMLAQCSTGLIVLSPPASHYDHYDSMRLQLYEFVLDFQRAANRSVGEQVFVIADESARRDLLFGYGVADAIHGKLDDIWLRDLLVTQLSDTRVVRFRYRPAYLSQMLVSVVDTSTRALVGSIWPGGEVQPLDTLVLDGGGIVWEPSTLRAVVTERVLRDNPWLVNRTSLSADGKPPRPTGAAAPYADAPSISVAELAMARERLEALLSAALVGQEAGSGEVGGFDVTVAIVPEEDGAPRLGHVDGICNWLGPNTARRPLASALSVSLPHGVAPATALSPPPPPNAGVSGYSNLGKSEPGYAPARRYRRASFRCYSSLIRPLVWIPRIAATPLTSCAATLLLTPFRRRTTSCTATSWRTTP